MAGEIQPKISEWEKIGRNPTPWSCSCALSSLCRLTLRRWWSDWYMQLQLIGHVGRLPLPIQAAITGQRLAAMLQGLVPAPGQCRRPQHQHRFGVLHLPQDTVAFQAQVHHPPDRALDRTAAERQATLAELSILHVPSLCVLLQKSDLGPDL